MHDLVVRGGTVVDGTGAPARTADVAVDDGRITAVGSRSTGVAARQTIDADGVLVTPGLGRHPHPLRRPGHLGRGAGPERRGTA